MQTLQLVKINNLARSWWLDIGIQHLNRIIIPPGQINELPGSIIMQPGSIVIPTGHINGGWGVIGPFSH